MCGAVKEVHLLALTTRGGDLMHSMVAFTSAERLTMCAKTHSDEFFQALPRLFPVLNALALSHLDDIGKAGVLRRALWLIEMRMLRSLALHGFILGADAVEVIATLPLEHLDLATSNFQPDRKCHPLSPPAMHPISLRMPNIFGSLVDDKAVSWQWVSLWTRRLVAPDAEESRLTTLTWQGRVTELGLLFPRLPSLTHLVVDPSHSNAPDQDFVNLLATRPLPSLTHLVLPFRHHLFYEAWSGPADAITAYARQLRSLTLEVNFHARVVRAHLLQAILSCHLLESLSVGDLWPRSPLPATIAPCWPLLTELRIGGDLAASKPRNNVVSSVLAHCPVLQTLWIINIDLFSFDLILCTALSCPLLKLLFLNRESNRHRRIFAPIKDRARWTTAAGLFPRLRRLILCDTGRNLLATSASCVQTQRY
jgi:hypothetical protein